METFNLEVASLNANRRYRNVVASQGVRIQEYLTCFFVRPILRNRILGCVDVLQNFFEGMILLNEGDRPMWTDALDRFTIVAAKENAKINELNALVSTRTIEGH